MHYRFFGLYLLNAKTSTLVSRLMPRNALSWGLCLLRRRGSSHASAGRACNSSSPRAGAWEPDRGVQRGVSFSVKISRVGRFIIALLLIVAFSPQVLRSQESKAKKLEGYDLTFPAMGSTITLSAYSDSDAKVEEAFGAVRKEIDRLVMILSDYEPKSELNRLHQQASIAMPLSDELFEVLSASDTWHHRSEGAFDAAIGNVTRLWREARKHREIPSTTEIDEALLHSGWRHIDLNKNDRTLTLRDPKVRIDLGGIAAGYIVDRAYNILVAHGLPISLVNDGGDIRCGEAPPGREGWRIELAAMRSSQSERRMPRSTQSKTAIDSTQAVQANPPPIRRIFLKNASITTSGDLWQYIEIEGQRRSHIIDPRTGYGVLGPTMATVIAPECIDADAAATMLSVLGPERGLALLSNQALFEALYASRLSDLESLQINATLNFPSGISMEKPTNLP